METKMKKFKRGSIIKIELDNFMIYKHVEFRPGPFLNLILGPNGSGKSAIVCSIIMGFGGDPQITGRSSNLIDYIRFGSQSSIISIEIYSGDINKTNYLIQRELRVVNRNGKNECNNVWRLNRRIVNKNVISDFIQQLNIDINNLCQVLPQERVVEFARLSPKQLLVSTEKSFGDADMHEQHMRLITLSAEIDDMTQKIKDCNSFILKYQNFKSNIEPDLKLVKQKKKFEEEIEWLIKKQVWLQYEEKRLEYVELKEEFGIKKRQYDKFIQDLKPFKKRVDICETYLKELKSQKYKSYDNIRKFYSKLTELRKKQDYFQDRITDIISSYNEKISEQRRAKSRLAQYEQDRNNYKNDLLNYSNDEHFEQQLLACETELKIMEKDSKVIVKEIGVNKGKLDMSHSEKRMLDSKKNKITNVFNQRIEKISKNSSSARTACEWFNNNKEHFKGEVFLPIITQINVKRPEWARFVEAAIGSTDMSTFLFEYFEDLQYFVENLENDTNAKVNVAMLPKDCDMRNFQPTFDPKDYESYGIFSCVSELFTAPEKVMAYLCKNYNLHQIPVGNATTEDHVQHLIDTSPFRRILSSKNMIIIIVSRYDNEKTTRITPLKESRYLDIIVDFKETEKIDDQLSRINDTIEQTSTIIQDLNEKNEDFRKKLDSKMQEYKSHQSKKNEISIVKTKIKEKERQINSIKDTLASLNNQKVEVTQSLNKIQGNQFNLMQEINKLLGSFFPQIKTQIVANSKVRTAKVMQNIYDKNYSSMSLDEKNKRIELKNIDENLSVTRDEAKQLLNKAKNVSGFDFNKDVDPSILEKFKNLPDLLDDVRDAINVLKLKCEGIANIDESILEEYQKYQREIADKTTLCATLEKELASKETEINTIKPLWMESLNSLIHKINNNYSSFMDYLNYSGEVYLYCGSKDYAFDEYGIRVKVKFRDSEPMKDLDAYHQSGGERSVSTMIYMLSLQELANVPFRVVDEINQGMDETNERCVFDLIAEVSRKNSSQYFLLSPKLLTNLNYTDEMKVHIIFNGPHICVDWNKVFDSLLKK